MFGLSRMTPVQLIVLLVIGAVIFGAPLLQMASNPIRFIAIIVGLLVGITIHEASHATVAVALGDPTPRLMGRVSLNPLRHLDPLGALFMLIASFGWGKPVMFNPMNLRIDPRLGSALVSVAGPLSNVLLALVAAIFLHFAAGSLGTIGVLLVNAIIGINIALAAFNLIPIPPLDGFGFVINLLPKSVGEAVAPLVPYGPLILLALILFGPTLFHVNVLGVIMGPLNDAIWRFIEGVVLLFGTCRGTRCCDYRRGCAADRPV
jgi:Zn-dependent protease